MKEIAVSWAFICLLCLASGCSPQVVDEPEHVVEPRPGGEDGDGRSDVEPLLVNGRSWITHKRTSKLLEDERILYVHDSYDRYEVIGDTMCMGYRCKLLSHHSVEPGSDGSYSLREKLDNVALYERAGRIYAIYDYDYWNFSGCRPSEKHKDSYVKRLMLDFNYHYGETISADLWSMTTPDLDSGPDEGAFSFNVAREDTIEVRGRRFRALALSHGSYTTRYNPYFCEVITYDNVLVEGVGAYRNNWITKLTFPSHYCKERYHSYVEMVACYYDGEPVFTIDEFKEFYTPEAEDSPEPDYPLEIIYD